MKNVAENNAVLLGVDYARVEKLTLPDGAKMMDALRETVGCEWIEIVHPVGLTEPYLMVVDEEGLLKDRPALNVIASYLYGTHEHGQPIVGNAVIIKEVETDEGAELAWLTEEEELAIERKIEGTWAKAVMAMASYYENLEE